MPPVLQIYNIIRARPSFTFTCTDAITDSNAFIREALRFYTDCQSPLNIILNPMRPAVEIKRVDLINYVVIFTPV
ncbi:hypothetical protein DBN00_09215 [Salmonella enterica subsp. enterica serovar Nijmegen]|nr:hypothetical protein ELZ91_13280 [Salmonella enterica subsp. enterica serovar Waycross]EAB1946216.1 hypothetical protein [Salmonella enterica]EAS0584899.1 hypothetical protein [Salmonella enterica subsp. enterica serovar Clackamas]EBH8417364.1 hypothetical protein [Salmonella enterica subsp. enterica serovar Nijmegen]EBV4106851.1 hypothetical protein [Salmonella enterica subsp. enterica serovar Glostrup]ECH8656601.1 hypothetical protein [Salmonella enterica subsp. enterica serovar Nagoya]E